MLQVDEVDVADGLLLGLRGGPAQGDDIDLVSALGEGFGIAFDAGIGEEVGVGDHADAPRLAVVGRGSFWLSKETFVPTFFIAMPMFNGICLGSVNEVKAPKSSA